MLIKVEPGKKNSFAISQNQRIAQGEYDCILEASGPFGSLFSEKRHCLTLDEPAGQNKQDRNLNADEKSGRDVKESSKISDSEYKFQSQNEPIDETCAQIGNSAVQSNERSLMVLTALKHPYPPRTHPWAARINPVEMCCTPRPQKT